MAKARPTSSVREMSWTPSREYKNDGKCTICGKERENKKISWCKKCKKDKLRMKKYNITKKELDELLKKKCYICNSKKDLCIDHCHKTKLVRGVLCRFCNMGIGLLKDNIKYLEKGIVYLKNE